MDTSRSDPGDAAVRVPLEPADDGQLVQYHFPVEIEVRWGGEPVDPHAVADLALQRLADGLGSV